MAEEEKKEENQEESKPADSGGGNKLILIIIVVLLLLLLVIGGVVAYFLLASDEEQPQDQPQQQEKKEQKVEKKDTTKALEIGPIYPLDPFTVNLKSNGATRYLKCTINIEIDAPETQPELDKLKPAIRDIIIRILSSKTVPEISTAKGKEKLKEEIKKNINSILGTGEIRNVYFTAFVIQ